MNLRQILRVWGDVFGNWRYLLLAFFITVFFYSLNVIINGWRSLSGFYSVNGFPKTLNLLWVMLIGFRDTISSASFFSLVAVSVLFAVLFTLLIYKSKVHISMQDEEMGILGGIGVFLAAFAPGCAACGIGLASALGLGAGALAFLPYGGLELSLIAIVILGIVIFKTTKNMYLCEIPDLPVKKQKKSKRNRK